MTSNVARITVSLATALAGAVLPAAAQGGQQSDLDFFIGKWEVELLDAGGNVTGQAQTHAYWILDGSAMQDDWRSLDRQGNVVFSGTSVRTFVPATGRWAIHWIPANTAGYTYIDAEWIDGELQSTGAGFDARGAFKERFRYFDITPVSYTFKMERSYDDGATWSPWAHLRATKVTDAD